MTESDQTGATVQSRSDAQGTESSAARIGQINFINCLPLVLPIASGAVSLAGSTTMGTPAQLNQQLARGELDLASVSSYFYLSQANLELVPDLSISSDGPVGSVLFFSRSEGKGLHRKKVQVPEASATSVNLLRVLLAEYYGAYCQMVPAPAPNMDDPEFDGALVFGDRALLVDADWSRRFNRLDLGEWWQRTAGGPMVFGVWAVRKEFVAQKQEQYVQSAAGLKAAKALGLGSMLEEVIQEGQQRTGLDRERLRRYYKDELNFELTHRHRDSLELYAALCMKHRLL